MYPRSVGAHALAFVMLLGLCMTSLLAASDQPPRSVATGSSLVRPERLPDLVPPEFRNRFLPLNPPPQYVPKQLGHYSAHDWAVAIDTTWGPGMSTAQKQQLFFAIYGELSDKFPCFGGLDSSIWETVFNLYYPEISAGVSRGRFDAILNYACYALHDGHTLAQDTGVTLTTLLPGVPLLMNWGAGPLDHSGAALTPLPDSSLLVYSVAPSHPLGLAPGDIVLGYDGVPWKDLYKELLAANLPMQHGGVASSTWSSGRHSELSAAAQNWHLFDTIDIVKFATDDTFHLPTSAMVGRTMSLFGSEQLPVPGVLMPDFYGGQFVSWGIVSGTGIGYIYVWEWWGDAEAQFTNAVDSLVNHSQTTGIIIDYRFNLGGSMRMAYPGLGMLFDTTKVWIGFSVRCTPDNLQALCGWANGDPDLIKIPAQPPGYMKPIAVLTGPNTYSSGDFIALATAFHPLAKVFGKPTAGLFNSPIFHDYDYHPQFQFWLARYNSFLATQPTTPLTRLEYPFDLIYSFIPSERVWLTRDGVAQGRDDVVEAAKAWILSRDLDQDGVVNENDNCPNIYNPLQEDADLDGRGDSCCCVALTGNIDGDTGDLVDISDLSLMVDYLFFSGSISLCVKENDVDKSSSVDISDLSILVDFLFFSGALPSCP